MSPFNVNWNSVAGVIAGYMDYTFVHEINGVRPVISLEPGTSYQSGNGSSDTPYVITE